MSDSSKKPLLTYFLALFGLGLTTVTIGPTLPGLAEQVGVDISDISILITSKEIGHLFGALFLVRILDKMNGNKALGFFILVTAALLLFFPFITQLLILAILILMMGVFSAGMDSGTNTLLIWHYKEKSAKYLNGLHLMFGLGALAAPMLFASILDLTADIDWVFWLVGLILLPAGFLAFSLPEPDRPNKSDENSSSTEVKTLILFVAGFFFAYVAAEVAFSSWIYTYSLELNLADEILSAYLNSAFWGALTFGRLVSIPLAGKFRGRTLMNINFIGTFVSLAVFIFGQNSFILILAGCIGLGLSVASMFPTMMAIASKRLTITAKIGGLFVAGAALGGMSMPWLIGQLIESSGPSFLFYVVGVLLGISYIFYRLVILKDPETTT